MNPSPLDCRPGCGACCIAPSITQPIPGMPQGKPAGVRCVQLTVDNRCALFGRPERPAFCVGLKPEAAMCGSTPAQAMQWLTELEIATRPAVLHDQRFGASSGAGTAG
ncbi:YkgJ family cysteine cluster protein [Halothiobacillus sp. DCM-1]|uniref:YkgJ family cysteine cluster protein n=1 Tax=Halothiobacillus sp. DCM-1 TaxID=3112558 RepID=UPI00324FBA65